MPDNDLDRRLAIVEQTFGLRPTNTNDVVNQTNEPIQAQHTDNINWKALYKVLESEVETIVLDPNCPQYVRDWGNRIMTRLAQFIPRR
jgi:hypothetical protein|tara:strand:- start:14613 stop:14876 length:264 start_codon:yes stop_codon:yes gene_type:complete